MQTVPVDSEHVTIRRKYQTPSRWIAYNYLPNRRLNYERLLYLKNPSCPVMSRFNAARRL